MTPIQTTCCIILATIVLFAWNRLPVIAVAFAAALSLWAAGLVTLDQALAGFGDRAVLFVASLFIVSAALERTGVTAWCGQALISLAGQNNRSRLLFVLMISVGCLTSLLSGSGAVAALMPIAVFAAVRLNQSPAQLLMPLAFAAHAGANLLLTGAPKNFLVSEALEDAGLEGFGFTEFALVGVPLLAGTVFVVLLLGKYLLPRQTNARLPADFSGHAQTLVEHYGLEDGLFRLRVRRDSPLVGLRTDKIDLGAASDMQLMAVQAAASGLLVRDRAMIADDYLLVRGTAQAVAEVAARLHLAVREDAPTGSGSAAFNRRSGLAEVMIPPRSKLIGQSMFPGLATESGDLVVLAVHRGGAEIDYANPELKAGDTILLEGSWEALDLRLDDPDVLVVDSPDLVRRHAVPMGPGAKVAVATLIGLVVMLASNIVPPAVAGILCACVLVASGAITVEQSYRAVHWTTVILIGAMMPISTAMIQSGTAKFVADELVSALGSAGPSALVAGLFVLTAVLGQVMSNTATTMLVIPIAMAAASAMHIQPHPVLMSLCIAGSASFMTPIATTTNMMVMGAGGYRFGDYWKLGTPLMAWFFIVAVFLVPRIWPFT
ncbi:SLC13 family permease [Rhizobium sp. 16-449-1b]|uniref:SLC13 family permease n=1 Tax=Rhizobium sp. 16-449-1b TaxID=2819989 RepID=UPI001ADAB86F|nr:SLC13 family permease [Rhizobium sp. 16-449-1b]MBO9196917.1 SLC13 family permease [Rhizobium sp. 16-449-1b]